jgi:hypothetical protein
MAIDWSTVGSSVEQAVTSVVGADWGVVAPAAKAQLSALVQTAQAIEADKDNMSAAEYNGLRLSQQRALEGVLSAYAAISIVVAEQAAAAAWNVVAQALKAAYPALSFL